MEDGREGEKGEHGCLVCENDVLTKDGDKTGRCCYSYV